MSQQEGSILFPHGFKTKSEEDMAVRIAQLCHRRYHRFQIASRTIQAQRQPPTDPEDLSYYHWIDNQSHEIEFKLKEPIPEDSLAAIEAHVCWDFQEIMCDPQGRFFISYGCDEITQTMVHFIDSIEDQVVYIKRVQAIPNGKFSQVIVDGNDLVVYKMREWPWMPEENPEKYCLKQFCLNVHQLLGDIDNDSLAIKKFELLRRFVPPSMLRDPGKSLQLVNEAYDEPEIPRTAYTSVEITQFTVYSLKGNIFVKTFST